MSPGVFPVLFHPVPAHEGQGKDRQTSWGIDGPVQVLG